MDEEKQPVIIWRKAMKSIATILLGLVFCSLVSAQSPPTMRDLHLGCEAWQRVMALPDKTKYTQQLVDDLTNGGHAVGYIAGWVDAMNYENSPITNNAPQTVGDTVDAVCKYIDLHPELWSKDRGRGLVIVLTALYGKP
jgi:hypothetical protein